MNVFVREWAHQSAVARCLHQCVQGTPHRSIIQEAPSSFQKEKKISHRSAVEKAQHLKRSLQGLCQFLEEWKKRKGGKVPWEASSSEFVKVLIALWTILTLYWFKTLIKHYLVYLSIKNCHLYIASAFKGPCKLKALFFKVFIIILNYNLILLFFLSIKHINISWKYFIFMNHSYNNYCSCARYYFTCCLNLAYTLVRQIKLVHK